MKTLRGAITVKENTAEDIHTSTELLLKEIIEQNNLDFEEIEAIIFSVTSDLDAIYPAEKARQMGLVKASLMCLSEMNVVGSLEKCIRVMLFLNLKTNRILQPVYLRKAAMLRKDITEGRL